jgi:hypothetical protein
VPISGRNRTALRRVKRALDWAYARYGDPSAEPPSPLARRARRRIDADFVAFVMLYTAVVCLLRGESADDLLDDLDRRQPQRRLGLRRPPGGEGMSLRLSGRGSRRAVARLARTVGLN